MLLTLCSFKEQQQYVLQACCCCITRFGKQKGKNFKVKKGATYRNQKCKLPRTEDIYDGVVSSLTKDRVSKGNTWRPSTPSLFRVLNTPHFCICCSKLPFPNMNIPPFQLMLWDSSRYLIAFHPIRAKYNVGTQGLKLSSGDVVHTTRFDQIWWVNKELEMKRQRRIIYGIIQGKLFLNVFPDVLLLSKYSLRNNFCF